MNPFDALGKIAVGFIQKHVIEAWLKLAASFFITAFVAFFGTLGLTVTAQIHAGVEHTTALILGVAYASLIMALSVLNLWKQSSLTKGIPILYSGKIEQARVGQMQEDGTVFDPNKK